MPKSKTAPTLKSFFGFARHPFPPSCPPEPLFRTAALDRGLSAVHSALRHRLHGMVTAAPGLGKSCFARLLAAQLNPRDIQPLSLVGQPLSVTDFLQRVCELLGIDPAHHRGLALKRLTAALRARDASPEPFPVLILDEAHGVPFEALDLLRTVAEDAARPLLSMVLLGDETLHGQLRRQSAAALAGRLAARVRLQPWDEDETAAFVEHAFAAVGLENLLAPTALPAVFAASGGVPRRVTALLRAALDWALAREARLLSDEIVQEAIDGQRA